MITKVEKDSIPSDARNHKWRGHARLQIEEFVKTGWDACKLDISPYANMHSAFPAINRVLKEYPGIYATTRNGDVYLIREDAKNV